MAANREKTALVQERKWEHVLGARLMLNEEIPG